jgi:hypothetical protein
MKSCLSLRGHFDGKMALGDADWSSSPLAYAPVLFVLVYKVSYFFA